MTNTAKNKPILVTFWTQNPEEIPYKWKGWNFLSHMKNFATVPFEITNVTDHKCHSSSCNGTCSQSMKLCFHLRKTFFCGEKCFQKYTIYTVVATESMTCINTFSVHSSNSTFNIYITCRFRAERGGQCDWLVVKMKDISIPKVVTFNICCTFAIRNLTYHENTSGYFLTVHFFKGSNVIFIRLMSSTFWNIVH